MLSSEISRSEDGISSQEVCVSGVCAISWEVEAKLDEGNIHEAECSLQEGLSLNYEVGFLFQIGRILRLEKVLEIFSMCACASCEFCDSR